MTPEKGLRRLSALCRDGSFDAAASLGARLVAAHPDEAAFRFLLGCAQAALGRTDDAVATFTNLIARAPDHAAAHYNIGILRQEQGQGEAAIAHFFRATQLDPGMKEAGNNLGNALRRSGRSGDAVRVLRDVVARHPDYLAARINLADSLRATGARAEALALARGIAAEQPGDPVNRALLLRLQGEVCDFAAVEDFATHAPTLDAAATLPPHACLYLEDDPARQLVRAGRWSARQFGRIAAEAVAPPGNSRPRIGYFSVNLHDHPTLYLIAELFRQHDGSRFDIRVYDLAPPRESAMKARLRTDVPGYRDVHRRTDAEIARLARADGLDIAIDLDGELRGTRRAVFAHRAAAVQVGFLGFAGTSGAPFMDYLIADRHVIPKGERPHYSERVVYLPESFWPANPALDLTRDPTSRRAAGLPEDGVVLCSFNAAPKIGADAFGIWMRAMKRAPDCKLWLLDAGPEMRDNLRRAALRRGVDPERLIFAPRVDQAAHLARLAHADLVVDTFRYNGHTTASDALRAGVPVLTCPGRQFAARVAASILHAARLPDMIARSQAEYEARLLALVGAPGDLRRLRARLVRNHAIAPLFDPARYARQLEAAYLAILTRQAQGLAPVDIHLSAPT